MTLTELINTHKLHLRFQRVIEFESESPKCQVTLEGVILRGEHSDYDAQATGITWNEALNNLAELMSDTIVMICPPSKYKLVVTSNDKGLMRQRISGMSMALGIRDYTNDYAVRDYVILDDSSLNTTGVLYEDP